MKKLNFFGLTIISVLALASCRDDSLEKKTGTGFYIDSAVSGIKYVCGTENGVTDKDGTFTYEKGQNCTFSLNGIVLRITPDSQLSDGKKVIISETGWPTKGEKYGDALPSYENAMEYFILTHTWVQSKGIESFYFSSFDEVWKMNHEGEYGAYWGIWDKDGLYKFKKQTQIT